MKCTVLFFTLVCCGCNISVLSQETRNLKSLSPVEKLGILTICKFQPKLLPQLCATNLLSDIWFIQIIDYFFVDFRSVLTQFMKIPEQTIIPEIDWSYRLEFCVWVACIDHTYTLTTNNTQIIGTTTTTSANEMTPTSFKNSFKVPEMTVLCPDFRLHARDNAIDTQYLWEDFYIRMTNLAFNLSANYDFIPDLGVQVSNLFIDFEIGYLTANLARTSTIYPNGTVAVVEHGKLDYTRTINESWKLARNLYIDWLQFRINCVLSSSRNDPKGCNTFNAEEETLGRDYYKMNVLQLIQTIGLGSLD